LQEGPEQFLLFFIFLWKIDKQLKKGGQMKRRDFITTAAAGSLGALAGSAFSQSVPATPAAQPAPAAPAKSGQKIKITVLKRTLNDEWNKAYREGKVKLCSAVQDNQEFILESSRRKPEGLCDWAWADIRVYIQQVDAGKFDTTVACCTDGFRPVFFKVERLKV
jgi:uncharacterized repeat protein (TIGR04076 family)